MLFDLREDYGAGSLDATDLCNDPFAQFHEWFQDTLRVGVKEPNAMTLATATPDGKPSARVVLLKDYSSAGFTFFTNYESRKGQELLANPQAALVFLWLDLQRQVRLEGVVAKMSTEASEAYFHSRPRGSQVGAWASPQSRVIPGREVLEKSVQEIESRFEHSDKLPLPAFWGGFLLRPDLVEFWQGRSSRLHDRFRYALQPDGTWNIERLAP